MLHPPFVRLKQFAALTAGRVRAQLVISANAGEPLTHELRGAVAGRTYHLRAGASVIQAEVRVSTSAAPFAVHEPDLIMLADLQIASSPLPLFVDRSERFHRCARSWLEVPENLRAVQCVECRDGEALYVVANWLTLRVRSDRDLGECLQQLADLASHLEASAPPVAESTLSPDRLPPALRPLLPLAVRYGIADDGLREEMAHLLSSSQRRTLIRTVGPLLPEIDAWLATLDEPHPNEALRLGDLAQLVAELRLQCRSGAIS